MAVPNGLKIPPLEQRKKRGCCKYHNFLGYKTSHCVLFKDLVKRSLNKGRLRFGDRAKPQMQVDGDRLNYVGTMYTKVASYNVVEAIADVVERLYVEAKDDVVECQMVEVSRSPKVADEITPKLQFDENAKAAYPMVKEELIDFLNRC